MNYSSRSIAAIALLALTSSLHAETLVEYAFPTSSTSASTTGSNVTTAAFTRGSGLSSLSFSTTTGAPSARSVFVTSAQVNDAISPTSTDWLGFTISASGGNKMDLSSLSFYYAYTNTNAAPVSGTATFDVRSSVDNYATTIASYDLSIVNSTAPNWTFASIGLSAVAYQDLDTISFRIFLNDGSNSAADSQLRLDTVTLSGVSSTIPEPSTYALLVGAGGLLIAGLRRRNRA